MDIKSKAKDLDDDTLAGLNIINMAVFKHVSDPDYREAQKKARFKKMFGEDLDEYRARKKRDTRGS